MEKNVSPETNVIENTTTNSNKMRVEDPNFPVFYSGALIQRLSGLGNIEDFKEFSNIWRNAGHEQKQGMVDAWERAFKWAANIAAEYNLKLKWMLGKIEHPDEICSKCFGTGFFVKWGVTDPIKRTCPECQGEGYQIAKCNKCAGNGTIDGDEVCPICKGRGYFIYFQSPCKRCGVMSPSGTLLKGTGEIILPKKTIEKIDYCTTCAGWGSLHPDKNPYMAK